MPLWPLCENVKRNYLNRGNHTRECTAFVKPYYGAQPRICYKHRKWIVDSTDLRTFRRDHTGAGGQLVIELSVCWARGTSLPLLQTLIYTAINYRWFQQSFSSLCLFQAVECENVDLYAPSQTACSLCGGWRRKKKLWMFQPLCIKLWWAVMNKMEARIIRWFRFHLRAFFILYVCSQMWKSTLPLS